MCKDLIWNRKFIDNNNDWWQFTLLYITSYRWWYSLVTVVVICCFYFMFVQKESISFRNQIFSITNWSWFDLCRYIFSTHTHTHTMVHWLILFFFTFVVSYMINKIWLLWFNRWKYNSNGYRSISFNIDMIDLSMKNPKKISKIFPSLLASYQYR